MLGQGWRGSWGFARERGKGLGLTVQISRRGLYMAM